MSRDVWVLEGGRIWTGDPGKPWTDALWLEGGRVRALGRHAHAAPLDIPRVQLEDSLVTPGLIDAHAHFLLLGRSEEEVDLEGVPSLEEALARVGSRSRATPAGWVLGGGWDQNLWAGHGFPRAQDLDGVADGRPVCLHRVDRHAVWVNSAALRAAGITRSTPDPEGGRIVREADGSPTGILIDRAAEAVLSVIPSESPEASRRAARRAAVRCASAGLTGVHDMGLRAPEVALLREMAREGALDMRIYGALLYDDPGAELLLERGPDEDWENGAFKLGMVKFFSDGALGSRGASLLDPYCDAPGESGLALLSGDALVEGLSRARSHGFQCAVHAIGDRANRETLDAWEAVREDPGYREDPTRPPGLRLEHAQILHPRDLARLAALEVVASMQPVHWSGDREWVEDRLGQDRLTGSYAWGSVHRTGVPLVLGSDFPIESENPVAGLWAAVTQGDRGRGREEALTLETALVASSRVPAYVSGDQGRLGGLFTGAAADCVVWDRDFFREDPSRWRSARALATLIGGRLVWSAPGSPVS